MCLIQFIQISVILCVYFQFVYLFILIYVALLVAYDWSVQQPLKGNKDYQYHKVFF